MGCCFIRLSNNFLGYFSYKTLTIKEIDMLETKVLGWTLSAKELDIEVHVSPCVTLVTSVSGWSAERVVFGYVPPVFLLFSPSIVFSFFLSFVLLDQNRLLHCKN